MTDSDRLIQDRQYIITMNDKSNNSINSFYNAAIRTDKPQYIIRELKPEPRSQNYIHREFERLSLIRPSIISDVEGDESNDETIDEQTNLSLESTELVRNNLLRRLHTTPPSEFDDYNTIMKQNGANNNRCDTASTQTTVHFQDQSVHVSVSSNSISTQTCTTSSNKPLTDVFSADEVVDISDNENATANYDDESLSKSMLVSELDKTSVEQTQTSSSNHSNNIDNNVNITGPSEIMKCLQKPVKKEYDTFEYVPNNLLYNNQYPASHGNNRCNGFNDSNQSFEFNRTYIVKSNDEIIQSHFAKSDRRLKAIANRIRCKIEIMGPYTSNYERMYSSKAELFNLTLHSASKVRLEKAANCLSVSFPNSNFALKLLK